MWWRRLLSWLASLLMIVAFGAPAAFAQQERTPMRMEYGKDAGEKKEHGPPALQYTAAAVSLIVIMVILCMPSRKRNIAG
jgi:hypothetical protein